jgi:PhnB protein
VSKEDYTRPGFHTVTPYLIVRDAPQLIDFLVEVFGGQELRRDLHADGSIMNAEIRVGSSLVELAEASEAWPAFPAALHVYLPDTDAVYHKALAAGAGSLYAPADMPYGERSAGIKDPYGNHWFLATYQEQAS